MLIIKDLKKNYRKGNADVPVLNHLNLVVRPGEMVAVQGASGCGKTTLLLIAGGLLHPTEGSVFFNEINLYEKNPAERTAFRAHRFGFVFQQYHLIPYLTVLENILLPELTMNGPDQHKRAGMLIDHLGLSHRIKHLPAELSAGEKQRTALARAMLHSPAMILADEITGNLDEHNAAIVMQTLKNYAVEGKMVLYVTHDSMSTAFADRAVIIENNSLGNRPDGLVS